MNSEDAIEAYEAVARWSSVDLGLVAFGLNPVNSHIAVAAQCSFLL